MSCKCQICGKQYKVDILITDELWENKVKLPSNTKGDGLLCGECIIRRIETFSDYSAYKLTPITNLLSGKNEH